MPSLRSLLQSMLFATLFISLFGGATSPAQARCIYIYIDCPNSGFNLLRPGHPFVQLVAMGNNPDVGKTDLVYGFYPAKNPVKGPGKIKNDSRRPWDWRTCYCNITADQYNAAVDYITNSMNNPPDYCLLNRNAGKNCMSWVKGLAAAAGLVLPPFPNIRGERVGVPDPLSYWSAIAESLGDGGTVGGGDVGDNEDPTKGASGEPVASTWPRDFSYGTSEEYAHLAPDDLAEALQLPLEATPLASLQANLVDSLRVNITGVFEESTLISVDWGDGALYSAQSQSLAHRYQNSGVFSLSIAAVDAGAVRSYVATVTAMPGLVTSPVNLVITPDPPLDQTNPGFDNPVAPHHEVITAMPLPEWVPLLLVAFMTLLAFRLLTRGRAKPFSVCVLALAISCLLASTDLAFAGSGNPAYVFKGTADTGGAGTNKKMTISLKWKKGKESKNKDLEITVNHGENAEDVATKVKDAMNGDAAVSADWTFTQDSEMFGTYHFAKGTPKAGVTGCGADVGGPIKGLMISGGLDPITGTVTFDITGVGAFGQVSLQVSTTVITVATLNHTGAEVESDVVQAFQGGGIPAYMDVTGRVRIDGMPTDNLPPAGGAGLEDLPGGGGILLEDSGLGVHMDVSDPLCIETIPLLNEWGYALILTGLVLAAWLALGRKDNQVEARAG